jgi:hypothetical protein
MQAYAFCVARLAPELWGLTRPAVPAGAPVTAAENLAENAAGPRDR